MNFLRASTDHTLPLGTPPRTLINIRTLSRIYPSGTFDALSCCPCALWALWITIPYTAVISHLYFHSTAFRINPEQPLLAKHWAAKTKGPSTGQPVFLEVFAVVAHLFVFCFPPHTGLVSKKTKHNVVEMSRYGFMPSNLSLFLLSKRKHMCLLFILNTVKFKMFISDMDVSCNRNYKFFFLVFLSLDVVFLLRFRVNGNPIKIIIDCSDQNIAI